MAAWRMAFRAGKNGDELWPACYDLRVAVIEYSPMDDIDLSRYEEGEPKSAWMQLAAPQHTSLRRLAYEIKKDYVIYVKQGRHIVGKGLVEDGYRFDKKNRIRDLEGTPWQHQVPVTWALGFPEIAILLGKQQAMTLVPLNEEDVRHMDQALAACYAEESDIEGNKTEAMCCRTKRSRRLRDMAFKAAKNICAACDRDYSKILGGRGVRVLQVHHRKQLAARESPSVTKLSDLVVVCANCHLLLHLDPRNALTVEQLREMLEADRRKGGGW